MLYSVALVLHNTLRWLVVGSLLGTLVSAYSGLLLRRSYTKTDQTWRVVATSIAHTQLLLGVYLYILSPLIRYYWQARPGLSGGLQLPFFALIHSSLMLTAIVVMTVGSSLTKRQTEARRRFSTTAIYFTIGLLLIAAAIPWPFSPVVARPWIRPF